MFKIKESGKNGIVEMTDKGLIRTIRKTIGKDDTQFFPWSAVSHTQINRKMVGASTLIVFVGVRQYEWKTNQASEIATAVNEHIS
jgi:hypothetical protein